MSAGELQTQTESAATNRWKPWLLRARKLFLWAVAAYVGVILLLLFFERKLIFHPTKASTSWDAPPGAIAATDVELPISEGRVIHAWWCTPKDWKKEDGVVLYCHGNAGNLSHRGDGIQRWQEQLGIAVLIFDYPGYGKSTGKPDEQGCYEAGHAAITWLKEKQSVSEEDILLVGGSLGGGIAVEMATTHRSRGLVLISAFTSIPDMAARQYPWLPVRALVRTRFENLKKISTCSGPVFIAHGTADRLVPFEMGERLLAAAKEPKRLFPMDGYDHQHTPPLEFYAELKQFLIESNRKARASTERK